MSRNKEIKFAKWWEENIKEGYRKKNTIIF